jgi:hypothetical protein
LTHLLNLVVKVAAEFRWLEIESPMKGTIAHETYMFEPSTTLSINENEVFVPPTECHVIFLPTMSAPLFAPRTGDLTC